MNTKPQELTNQEVLTKAIQKAIDGGWKQFGYKRYLIDQTGEFVTFDTYDGSTKEWMSQASFSAQLPTLIFDHSFAKALWGTKIHQTSYEDFPEEWQYHLQQMVIAEDPIKYLGDNT